MKKTPPEILRLPGLEDPATAPARAPASDLQQASQSINADFAAENGRSHRAAAQDEEKTEGRPHHRPRLINPHD